MAGEIVLDWYAPSEAEDGKFARIDPAVLQSLGYPATGGKGRFALFTYSLNPATLSAGSISIPAEVSAVIVGQNMAGPLEVELPVVQTTYIHSGVFSDSVSIITPATPYKMIEIYNNSSNQAFFLLSATATKDSLTAVGLVVDANAYYAIKRDIPAFCLCADTAGTDLRVIGHA